MPRLYACPNGHRWEDTFGDFDSVSADSTVACPVCGVQVRVEVPKPPSTFNSSPPSPPPSATVAINQVPLASPLRHERPTAVNGYEILGELGRGGMGVVYKARDQRLQRTVALKMLLAGAHASEINVTRFRAEAEAVARLQHPNIVQIYEIGEQDDRPYFSMEFVDGQNLVGHIGSTPQPAREAARLTATLARAMQAAHERGIIHRDLKPANVLLTRDGTPKITDFGLAKRLDDVSSQTRTGEVMGTPSYMAPEQATGRIREIGPPTDVYALGTILYEMLTARPPFKAETAMDTMLQVLQAEPVPPGRLRAQMPRDLETICLKCLAKEPAKRYPSARALAEDLEKFLDNRPIAARPAGVWERGAKWVRRRPAVAALLASILLAFITVGTVVGWSYVELKRLNEQLKETAANEQAEAEAAREERRKAVAASERANQQEQLAQEQRKQAQENFQKARQAVRELLAEVAQEELTHIPLMEGVRQKLLTRAVEFQRSFLARQSQEPSIRQQAAQANLQVGEINHLLGRHAEADKAYREGIDLFAHLADQFPRRADYRHGLALGHFQHGRLLRDAGQRPKAEEAFRTAIQIQNALKNGYPDESLYRQDLAHTHNDLGLLLHQMNRQTEADKAYQEALKLQTALVQNFPDNKPEYREDLAGTYNDLGKFLRAKGEPEKAARAYEEALRLLRPLAEKPGAAPEHRRRLAATSNNLGNVRRDLLLGGKAEASFNEALKHRLQLRNEFPSYLAYRLELAQTYNNLAALLAADSKRQPEAERAYAEAAKGLQDLVGNFPTAPDLHNSLAAVLDNQTGVLLKEKKVAAARKVLQEAAAHHEAAGLDRPAYRPQLRNHYAQLADALLTPAEKEKTPRYVEAAKAATELPRLFPDDHGAYLKAAVFFARCRNLAMADPMLTDKQRQSAVERYAGQSLAMLQQAVARGYRDVAQLKAARVFIPLYGRPEFKKLLETMAPRPETGD